jgi:hypothetical protein
MYCMCVFLYSWSRLDVVAWSRLAIFSCNAFALCVYTFECMFRRHCCHGRFITKWDVRLCGSFVSCVFVTLVCLIVATVVIVCRLLTRSQTHIRISLCGAISSVYFYLFVCLYLCVFVCVFMCTFALCSSVRLLYIIVCLINKILSYYFQRLVLQ